MIDLPTSGLLIAAAIGLACLATARLRYMARKLRKRDSFVVLAADEFDPKDEDVQRHALRLPEARGSFSARTITKPTTAIRLRLDSKNGNLRYIIECPSNGSAIIRSSMMEMGKCELVRNIPEEKKDTDIDLIEDNFDNDDGKTSTIENDFDLEENEVTDLEKDDDTYIYSDFVDMRKRLNGH